MGTNPRFKLCLGSSRAAGFSIGGVPGASGSQMDVMITRSAVTMRGGLSCNVTLNLNTRCDVPGIKRVLTRTHCCCKLNGVCNSSGQSCFKGDGCKRVIFGMSCLFSVSEAGGIGEGWLPAVIVRGWMVVWGRCGEGGSSRVRQLRIDSLSYPLRHRHRSSIQLLFCEYGISAKTSLSDYRKN